MNKFTHLHVHSKYSILDGAAEISQMYEKAVNDNMPAIALTDHGNMFGVFKFVAEAEKYNKKGEPPVIKPIVGCEFYLVEDRHRKQFTRDLKDMRFHQLLLAKNQEGYNNLVKLCSLGYMEGFYSKYPRIDKELLLRHHKGLIATTCCLAAEVPRAILNKGEEEGEKLFKWWLDIFGEDYYVELQRHQIPEQNKVNEVLVKFARKYNVKIIATNDTHYVEQDFYDAHDILLCVNTGEKKSTPTNKDYNDEDSSVKGRRFAFYNDQFYFKTTQEMSELFSDLPEAIDNTNEIAGKVELLNLKKEIMLPHFALPKGYTDQFEYLHHLTYAGARQRYAELTPEITDRLEFELGVIRQMGFTGYFLIVSDFIKAGRDLGVFIGPGRGSAAGSVVAYCIGITSIDPIKYKLLFERFLNPDRKSMPDIDTDFDDEGRQKVIDYVVDKYGHNQVAQIVTFGSMAAKSSIKDVARVLDLPLNDSNNLAKLVPDKPGIELKRVMQAPLEGAGSLKEKESLLAEDLEDVRKLREIAKGKDLQAEVLREAVKLEGSVRSTGIHAAGIIIAPSDLTDIIPVHTSKETNLLITQFEGKEIESAGVIKMDFLGLKTLSIIRDALRLIEENHGIKLNIDEVPLDDKKTLELYQKGETNGTFQFESAGMQKHLRELKPDKFEDLIAMNALYRPGPMEYIPNFISRKFGREKVVYDLPELEEYLEETYGITVYQEQVMLLSQKLAGFTKGDADTLRKAMGKKDKKTLDEKKGKYIEGCKKNNLDLKACEKIWTDWEAFAAYAFNKSHSTCYAFVAFQTAYLKAHYPAEYMAAVLTHNLSDIKKITFFIDETRRMGIPVLSPDVNESGYHFAVNKNGEIRFGMGAVKGVGENAVMAIMEERAANGPFKDILDLTRRVNLRTINRRSLEALAKAGAFDTFEGSHRAQYFYQEAAEGPTFLDKVLRHASEFQAQKLGMQVSLFGGESEVEMPEVEMPECEAWSNFEQLKNEKEVTGFYMSGHPLDDYSLEIKSFCKNQVSDIREENIRRFLGKTVSVAGIVSSANERMSKNNTLFGSFTIEDHNDTVQLMLFSDDYLKFRHLLVPGMSLMITGTVQKRFRDSDLVELKVSGILLLAEVTNKLTSRVSIQLEGAAVDQAFVEKLKDAIVSSPGKAALDFMISDEMTSNLKMTSRYMVNPYDLAGKLKHWPALELKLS
ncbi:DNA polymerase III subunit alpha [Lentimicrobium sp.]|uniref:DNA polymerase III subunit alpha n=1 Tax=Lentimicrobium sp. TaxID=2034841 RepID=UPI002C8F74EB|nr:DNA polymerase III subunit alpha [Lentimicrobium sp.]MCO5262265.1 DNA polymerase III subunit alpha [Lentimicrobium sp.]HPJ60977.1 DNA polymerase III subunit alpha [Lentimicrobium sp.]